MSFILISRYTFDSLGRYRLSLKHRLVILSSLQVILGFQLHAKRYAGKME